MAPLLAEDLLLLYWDSERGRVATLGQRTVDIGVTAALVLDALDQGVAVLRDRRLQPSGPPPTDPLLADLVAQTGGRRSDAALRKLLHSNADDIARPPALMLRLVERGVLHSETQRKFGIFPVMRFHTADPAAIAAVRDAVVDVLTGHRAPQSCGARPVLLAALVAPLRLDRILLDRSQRGPARDRVDQLSRGELPPSVPP